MPNYRNFQINTALGETWKPPDPLFLKENRGWLEASEFHLKLFLIGNCYKSAYLEPRTITKTNLEVGGQAPATPTPPVVWVVL